VISPARRSQARRPFEFQIRAHWNLTAKSLLAKCQTSALATIRLRRRERDAVLATLERFGLVRRTRGGAPLRPVEQEITS